MERLCITYFPAGWQMLWWKKLYYSYMVLGLCIKDLPNVEGCHLSRLLANCFTSLASTLETALMVQRMTSTGPLPLRSNAVVLWDKSLTSLSRDSLIHLTLALFSFRTYTWITKEKRKWILVKPDLVPSRLSFVSSQNAFQRKFGSMIVFQEMRNCHQSTSIGFSQKAHEMDERTIKDWL